MGDLLLQKAEEWRQDSIIPKQEMQDGRLTRLHSHRFFYLTFEALTVTCRQSFLIIQNSLGSFDKGNNYINLI